MNTQAQSASGYLAGSPHTRVLGAVDLGFGRNATIWRNSNDRVRYDDLKGHTFSFYTRGGNGTRRVDGRHSHGWAGALCIMPHGASSSWEITEEFEFLHLYLPDDEMRRAYGEAFDADARLMDLADVTYEEAPELARPFGALFAATRAGEGMQAEEAMSELVAGLFASGRFAARRRLALAGGLTPAHRRRVMGYIEENLDQMIRLADLAGLLELSEFHFQRAFRASVGVTPHGWIAHRRAERAKALIRAGEPLAQVADACGYSSQSHFTRAFKAATGATPARWRAGV
ncbi:MAG: AraC family transcriptional regulator [Maritimibacter sp.]